MPVSADALVVRWDGCYDDGWRDLIVPEAFSHPAKMSRGLVTRIFCELIAGGYLHPGDFVVDPFGGIGSTGIACAPLGLRFVGCELEPHFVRLATDYGCPGFAAASWVRFQHRWTKRPDYADLCPSCRAHRVASSRITFRRWLRGDRSEIPLARRSPPGQGPHHFVGNFEKHRRDWEAMGYPQPVMVQGDSRQLRAVIGPALAAAVVSSPPYAGNDKKDNTLHDRDPESARFTGAFRGSYGRTDGQLGAMASGDVDAVISSPPYAEISSGAGGLNTKPAKAGQQGGRSPASASQDTDQRYGDSAGQLAKLPAGDVAAIISSPPYSTGDSASAQSISTRTDKSAAWVKQHCGSAATEGYGTTSGQLGEMPAGAVADALVSSPPYEGSLHASDDGIDWEAAKRNDGADGEHQKPGRSATAAYPVSAGNIGNAQGDTFWDAALDIVRESYAILKPGGIAVWVVKHFVRKGKLVDFPGDWRRLCEHVGFETVQEVHASLVTEEVKPHLFDGERTTKRERKSFFRRLAEKKGSPRIDHETALIMRRPA